MKTGARVEDHVGEEPCRIELLLGSQLLRPVDELPSQERGAMRTPVDRSGGQRNGRRLTVCAAKPEDGAIAAVARISRQRSQVGVELPPLVLGDVHGDRSADHEIARRSEKGCRILIGLENDAGKISDDVAARSRVDELAPLRAPLGDLPAVVFGLMRRRLRRRFAFDETGHDRVQSSGNVLRVVVHTAAAVARSQHPDAGGDFLEFSAQSVDVGVQHSIHGGSSGFRLGSTPSK